MKGRVSPWSGTPTKPGLTAYTPSRSGLALGSGTEVARWCRTREGLIHVRYSLRFGSGTAISGTVSIGLPVAAHASGEQNMIGLIASNGGGTVWPTVAYIQSGGVSTVAFWLSTSTTASTLGLLGSFGLTMGSNSLLSFSGTYEPA